MSLDRDNLSDHDLTLAAQAVRQMAQDIFNAATAATKVEVRDVLNDHADTWVELANKIDWVIEGDV